MQAESPPPLNAWTAAMTIYCITSTSAYNAARTLEYVPDTFQPASGFIEGDALSNFAILDQIYTGGREVKSHRFEKSSFAVRKLDTLKRKAYKGSRSLGPRKRSGRAQACRRASPTRVEIGDSTKGHRLLREFDDCVRSLLSSIRVHMTVLSKTLAFWRKRRYPVVTS